MTRMRPPASLLSAIRDQGFDDKRRPVVSLEVFFEGNHDPASIGCNLPEHPGVAKFYAVLRGIRERPDVQDVLVAITDDMGDDEWPFSDCIYVLTRAPAKDVERWAAALEPDPDPAEGYFPGPPKRAPTLLPGHHVVTLWWD